ncbi:MAG TPA: transglutaminase domain-containing protein, partial [Bacteroidales bacterium]|nr:transglutaminase domain-containing protein [Bacteroidales bacterium]
MLFVFQACSNSSYVQLSYEEYLNILESYPDYDYEETTSLPQFTYSEKTDSNLVKIRKIFKLDSVAGDGDEKTRILNLMKWVHNTVPHDGSLKNPQPINTFNIMNVCKTENRGVNCRGLSVMLHEVYLSLGFKSRYITCLPAKKDYVDCHVINAVFSNELNKWLYIDPTFSAYLTDENGRMLSIQEVREKMLSGEKIIVNNDINWNGEPYGSSEYLTYISKNIFRLVSPIENEFDYESKSDRKFVELIPKGYDNSPSFIKSIFSIFSSR